MKTHDLIGSTNQLTADEHGRHRGAATEPLKILLKLTPARHLVQLINSWVHSKVTEESLD